MTRRTRRRRVVVQQARTEQPSGEKSTSGQPRVPARGARLSALLAEVRRAADRAAVLQHIGQRLFVDYSGEGGEPAYLVVGEDGRPVPADLDSLLEIQALLAQAEERAEHRVREILALELPTSGNSPSDVDSTPADASENNTFTKRVVPADVVGIRSRNR